MGLEVPLATAPVATVRATSVLLLTAERFHVLDQVVLPSIRLGTLGAPVSTAHRVHHFRPERSRGLSLGEITAAVPLGPEVGRFDGHGGIEYLIIVPEDRLT